MAKFNPLSQDPDEIERMWYVRPKPPQHAGWRVFSESFLLEVLQGCRFCPEKVKRTPAWRVLAAVVGAAMTVGQALLMLPSVLPVVNWLMYMLARGFPRGALGCFVRGCYWKTKLRRLGIDTLIDLGVEFTRPHTIEIGSRCHIDCHVLMTVGADTGYIRLGDYVDIGPWCRIVGRGGVQIGDFVALTTGVHIYSATNNPFHPDRLGELITMSHTVPDDLQYRTEGPVSVADYAVIGMASLILPGVALGRGVIVHAFSEVATSFPKFAIVSGPGRAHRTGWRRPGRLDPRLQEPENADS